MRGGLDLGDLRSHLLHARLSKNFRTYPERDAKKGRAKGPRAPAPWRQSGSPGDPEASCEDSSVPFGGAGKVVCRSGSLPLQRRQAGLPVPTAAPAALSSAPLPAARAAFAPVAGRSPRSSPGCRRRCSASFTSAPASFVSPLSAGFPSSSAPWGPDSSSSPGSQSPLPSPCQGLFPGRQRGPAPPSAPRPCPGICAFIVPGQFHFVILQALCLEWGGSLRRGPRGRWGRGGAGQLLGAPGKRAPWQPGLRGGTSMGLEPGESPAASPGPSHSPRPFPAARTHALAHTRAHTEGEGCSRSRAGLRNFALPSVLRYSSGRHSPALVLSPSGPAPLQLIGHSPAPRPRRPSLQPPLAGATTLVTVASEAVGRRWASPTAEALRRGRPPPTPFYLFIFPFGQTLAGVGAITARASRGIDGGGVRFGNK